MKYQFTTNINCSGCVAKVASQLDKYPEKISRWLVDTDNPNKILTVETDELSGDMVKAIVSEAGFKAELIH